MVSMPEVQYDPCTQCALWYVWLRWSVIPVPKVFCDTCTWGALCAWGALRYLFLGALWSMYLRCTLIPVPRCIMVLVPWGPQPSSADGTERPVAPGAGSGQWWGPRVMGLNGRSWWVNPCEETKEAGNLIGQGHVGFTHWVRGPWHKCCRRHF